MTRKVESRQTRGSFLNVVLTCNGVMMKESSALPRIYVDRETKELVFETKDVKSLLEFLSQWEMSEEEIGPNDIVVDLSEWVGEMEKAEKGKLRS